MNNEVFKANENNTNRKYKEEEHKIRGKFERDRDRIMYSKSFRRLEGKTQVFVNGYDDHIRNRLTHTLEVSQIARTITCALGLNEILAEAIALGHDLGHTPFGHVGERTLNYIMSNCDVIRGFEIEDETCKGFKHNYQGVRVVSELENYDKEKPGLNLTRYTMWGILHHSKLEYKECKECDEDNCMLRRQEKKACCNNKVFSLSFYQKYLKELPDENFTIEALIVGIADEIAQRHHDVEDALESGILEFNNLCSKVREIYEIDKREEKDKLDNLLTEKSKDYQMIKLGSFIVDFLASNAIRNIDKNLKELRKEYDINSSEEFEVMKKNKEFLKELRGLVTFEYDVETCDDKFQKYIYSRILNSYEAQCMDGKGNFIIREVFKAYATNPQQLEDKTIQRLFKNLGKIDFCIPKEGIEDIGALRIELKNLHSKDDNNYKKVLLRTICEYIAGMTDSYIMKLYSKLYEVKI